ncbi:MAG: hypothetical protein AAGE43_17945 [Pseudomonadota bacterium]
MAQLEISDELHPPEPLPLEVRIGFNLIDITAVREREETLEFEGAIYLFWNDPRLAYDPPGHEAPDDYSWTPKITYQGDYAVKEEFPGWRPHVTLANGIGDRNRTNMAVGIWPDGTVAYYETFSARVETPMALRRFPFDVQELEVFFHPFVYQREELVLIPDDSLARTWQQNMGIAEWNRGPVSMAERAVEIAYFDDVRETVSEFIVTIHLTRQPLHILTSIVFPMVLLVSLTWIVFWLDKESMTDRINITFIGILSVVAYYLVIQENVPRIDYLTLIDGFIIVTFLMLAAGVVLSVVTGKLDEKDQRTRSMKVDRICRWAFPLGYAAAIGLVHIIFFNLE